MIRIRGLEFLGDDYSVTDEFIALPPLELCTKRTENCGIFIV